LTTTQRLLVWGAGESGKLSLAFYVLYARCPRVNDE